MDLQKGKILLDKINALYSGMNSDADNIASIEKDLMRSYVRQFYEVLIDNGRPVAVAEPVKRKPVAKPIPVPKPVVKVVPPALTPKPVPVYKEPRIIELSEDVQEFVAETEPITPPVAVTPRSPALKPKPKPKPVPVVKEPEADEEVLQLFEQKKATDLSEKLSSLPVTDLMKAMGLNERILTVNELFGGDANAFKKAMTDLNTFSSFEEAKKYLAENVITKYAWTEAAKKKKAKILIKTIRRRYK